MAKWLNGRMLEWRCIQMQLEIRDRWPLQLRLGHPTWWPKPNHGFSFLSHLRLSLFFFFYRCLLLPLIDGLNGNIQWAKFAAVDGDYDLIG